MDRNELPNRLRELREASGLSIGDLAARVGATKQEIGHLELGKRRLTTDWLLKLAKALERHPWEIISYKAIAELTGSEAKLLTVFRSLSKTSQEALLAEAARKLALDARKNKPSK